MKKVAAVLCLVLFLTGCTGKRGEMDRAMGLRAKLLGCLECSFDVTITADYGDELYTFGMSCVGDNDGSIQFTVTQPETIAGITGSISAEGGKLTFDDTALSFELLADGQVTPVSGPWILMKTLMGGYLTDCVVEEDLLHLDIDDSYEDDALHLDIWLDQEDKPVQAEINYDGRRIVTMEVANFVIS
ncbi:MAG: hypothetical protein J6J18_07380 [Oscillospiraceae bacterium]|nr:hypothetical protein [Oscillospiraceae bacterium]